MKKFLSFILVLVVALTLFTIPSWASWQELTISDDFQTVYYNGKTYNYVMDSSAISYYVDTESCDNVNLTPSQEKKVAYIFADVELKNESFITVSIEYSGGGYVTSYYIESSYMEEYNQILDGEGTEYYTSFSYDRIPLDINVLLSGEEKTMTAFEISYYDFFDVSCGNTDGYFETAKGTILIDNTTMEFFYVDYPYSIISESYESVTAYKITDPDLVATFTAEYSEYNFGYGGSDIFAKIFFFAAVIFILGIVPLAILIISIISLIKAKNLHKRFLVALISLCGAEIISFVFLLFNMLTK